MRNDHASSCDQASSIMMKPLDSRSVAVQPNPLPRRQLFLIWLIHASQGFQTTMLFPMLVFMVERYGVTGVGGRAIGWRAGLLASLFPLAQFCTSMMWGVISDKTGRKPWLAFGCSVSAISALLLGICTTYQGACYLRFFGACSMALSQSPNLHWLSSVTESTMMNQAMMCLRQRVGVRTLMESHMVIFCRTNQAKGFGILNLAWGIGSVSGPVLSGLLAQPCKQYKMRNCPSVLKEHPFLLPCVGAAVFSIAGVMASLSFKETNPKFLRTSYNRISDLGQTEDQQGQSQQAPAEHKEVKLTGPSCKQKLIVLIAADERSATKHLMVSEAGGSLTKKEDVDPVANTSTRFSWIDRDVLMASLCYSMTGLIFIITDELFPMFGAASKSVGGLGFSSFALGLILGEGGVVLCLYTLIYYPRVAQRLGPLKCFRVGILSTIPIWLSFPVSSFLGTVPVLQWGLLLACMAARSVSACTCFTGVLILVSNAASPENMGAVTGLSHSFCSFFRAIGPAIGGLVWSYASGKRFFLHQFLAWEFVVLLSASTYGLSFYLPPTLTQPKRSVAPPRIEESTEHPPLS